MIRHKLINGICYIYEVKETYTARCQEHNPPKKPCPKCNHAPHYWEGDKLDLCSVEDCGCGWP